MQQKTKKYVIYFTLITIILSVLVMSTTTINENSITSVNMTLTGTILNLSTNDAIFYLYGSNSLLGGSPSSGGINFIQSNPQAKDGIWWNAYDLASDSTRVAAWITSHYNSSSVGAAHQHFSIETLDNSTGTPTLNSHLEIDYGSNLTRAKINFPSSDVNFISNQKLYFGDTLQASIMHNGTSGDLELQANADLKLLTTQLDMNSLDITGVDDIFGISGGSVDLKPDTTIRLFPSKQTSLAFVFNNDSSNAILSAIGTTEIQIQEILSTTQYIKIIGNITAITCNAANAGAIYYNNNTFKHYGCNVTDWQPLY